MLGLMYKEGISRYRAIDGLKSGVDIELSLFECLQAYIETGVAKLRYINSKKHDMV